MFFGWKVEDLGRLPYLCRTRALALRRHLRGLIMFGHAFGREEVRIGLERSAGS